MAATRTMHPSTMPVTVARPTRTDVPAPAANDEFAGVQILLLTIVATALLMLSVVLAAA